MRNQFLTIVGLLVLSLSSRAAVLPLEMRLGGQAYYDPNLDITWLADADVNGQHLWADQMSWVGSLSVAGVNGWRLPSADVNGDTAIVNCTIASEVDCLDNEMGFLYYHEGISSSSPGPFVNIAGGSELYWSLTDATATAASVFNFGGGGAGSAQKLLADYVYAWAVHDGDVAAVPVPAAAWLFGSALVGLAGLKRGR